MGLPWLEIPKDQACKAFAGEQFTNTKDEPSILFPTSPLRNCADGHDKLFTLIRADLERFGTMLEDGAVPAVDAEMFNLLDFKNLYTDGSCMDLSKIVDIAFGGLQGLGEFGGRKRRALKVVNKSKILMRELLKAKVGERFLNMAQSGSKMLSRRMEETIDLGEFMQGLEIIEKLPELCVHFPSGFSESCEFAPPELKAKGLDSSSGLPYTPFISLLLTAGAFVQMLF